MFMRSSILFPAQLIVKAVKERFNDGAAAVLEAALKITEPSQKNLTDVRSGRCISLQFYVIF